MYIYIHTHTFHISKPKNSNSLTVGNLSYDTVLP